MKKILILLLISSLCIADDIYLKQGGVIRNVKILGQSEKNLQLVVDFLYNGKNNYIVFDAIEKIVPVPYKEYVQSYHERDTLTTVEQPRGTLKNIPSTPLIVSEKQYPNMIFVTVAVVGIVVAWDGFAHAGNYQDQIDYNNEFVSAFNSASTSIQIQVDNSKLESAKTRSTIVGIVGLAAGIVSAVYSLQPVYMGTDGKSLSLAVNF